MRVKIGISSGAFDDPLDRIFYMVPVVGAKTQHINLEELLNIHQLLPGLFITHKADGNAHASETSSPSNTV